MFCVDVITKAKHDFFNMISKVGLIILKYSTFFNLSVNSYSFIVKTPFQLPHSRTFKTQETQAILRVSLSLSLYTANPLSPAPKWIHIQAAFSSGAWAQRVNMSAFIDALRAAQGCQASFQA